MPDLLIPQPVIQIRQARQNRKPSHLVVKFGVKRPRQGGLQGQMKVFSVVAVSLAAIPKLQIRQTHPITALSAAKSGQAFQIRVGLRFQLIDLTPVSCQQCSHYPCQECPKSDSPQVFLQAAAACWEADVCPSYDLESFSSRPP